MWQTYLWLNIHVYLSTKARLCYFMANDSNVAKIFTANHLCMAKTFTANHLHMAKIFTANYLNVTRIFMAKYSLVLKYHNKIGEIQ